MFEGSNDELVCNFAGHTHHSDVEDAGDTIRR